MIKALLSLYSFKFPTVITYMLQASEYNMGAYFKWLGRTKNFNQVIKRKSLVKTQVSDLVLLGLRLGIIGQIILGIVIIILGLKNIFIGGQYYGLAIIIAYPLVWPYLIVLLLTIAKVFFINPRDIKLATVVDDAFRNYSGEVVAVMGSYGKTSMKEILLTVLKEGKTVRATPDNKNVVSSQAKFVKTLTGKEDIVLVEYGEGKPGDITKFAKITYPKFAVITGLAPVHQDYYKDLNQQAEDLLSISKFVSSDNIFINNDSELTKKYMNNIEARSFNQKKVLDWKISDVKISIHGIKFIMSKPGRKLSLEAKIIGRHQVTFVAFAVAFADLLGLSDEQIVKGVANIHAYEHRMQPYQLAEAFIIDDTYNGNIEGIQAGLALLKELDFKRKIYVTPGLVDQGRDSAKIHFRIGEMIADTNPDIVVLMKNSVTKYIVNGLESKKFNKELRIEGNPLEFYLNLKLFVAKGDLVLMQNDWPDNYS